MARVKSSTKDTSSANLGFEATARHRSANPKGEAMPRSLEGNLWLSADSRGEAEPERSGDSPACFVSTTSGHTAKGSPQGERGGVHQLGVPPKTALRCSANIKPKGTPRVVSEAKDNMVALPGQIFYSTRIPVCLWFVGQDEPAGTCSAVSELELTQAA